MDVKEIAEIVAVLVVIGIAVYKNAQKMGMLKAVIKGVEEGVGQVSDEAIGFVKREIRYKAKELGVYAALHKVVKKLTK